MNQIATPSFWYLLRHPIQWLAFGLGSGLSPKAPGTVGTLMAIPFYIALAHLSLLGYAIAILLAFVVGIYFCQVTAKAQNCHDHPGIVWDEFVGYWITMFAVPLGWSWIIMGFILFRIFDIVKPWPISWCDKKIHGGLGIMIDDVLAGIFACVILHVITYVVQNNLLPF